MRSRPVPAPAAPAGLLLLGLWLCAQGCSSQYQVNSLARDLHSRSAEVTLERFEALDAPARDRALQLLSIGQLKLLLGDFNGSIAALEAAKQLINQVQALSVSETFGASTINETLRSYAGSPAERVLLHESLALNHLMLGRPGAARVEILQADTLMGQLAESGKQVGQVASTRYLGGLVFEWHREWDDALISYRKAAQILDRRALALPQALKQDLLRLTARNGLADEHQRWRTRFGFDAPPIAPAQGEVVVLYWQGQVSTLQQRVISVYAPKLSQYLSVAMPYYPPLRQLALGIAVDIAKQQRSTAVIEDLNQLVRNDLEARRGSLLAASLVRVVAKQQAVSAAQRDSPQLGALINLGTLLSEVADLRSWNILPSSIQVARITAAAGSAELSLNTGSWRSTTPLTITHGRPCLILAVEAVRQVFSQACHPGTHQVGSL